MKTYYVYYALEIDEMFTLPVKPNRPCRQYEMVLDGKTLLSYVIYLGEL